MDEHEAWSTAWREAGLSDDEIDDLETRDWLEGDLGGLSRYESYEWEEGELEAGEPVRLAEGER